MWYRSLLLYMHLVAESQTAVICETLPVRFKYEFGIYINVGLSLPNLGETGSNWFLNSKCPSEHDNNNYTSVTLTSIHLIALSFDLLQRDLLLCILRFGIVLFADLSL